MMTEICAVSIKKAAEDSVVPSVECGAVPDAVPVFLYKQFQSAANERRNSITGTSDRAADGKERFGA